ncbi:MAG TPA: glucan biosynthesis protein G [Candidatus Binatia bacterium]|nr:glucan biosynthesis protein G [Candidatus Binatia bacterium]
MLSRRSGRRIGRAARRLLLSGVLLLVAGRPAGAAALWETVVERARELAREPFADVERVVPSWLTGLTYDQWRDIRYRPQDALWNDGEVPFQVQLFHPGFYYNRVVVVNVVDGSHVTPVPFSPSHFDYGHNEFASRVPPDLGFAGFRLHAPIKSSDYFDEVIVFLGASYFRAVGRDQVFGLSSRGLAVDTAESHGEEFPFFREFWLEKPAPRAQEMVVYALLDSESVTGAYRFVVRPGRSTTTDVEVVLFPRRDIAKLGIAPLTSMFFHGENTERHFDDFRPEAHDSDGLLAHLPPDEWLWRPIDNPKSLQVTSFETVSPLGFGLVQRDRAFESYQDLETRAELRPSAWVEPVGAWGPGRIELVEIPTKSDTNDNVVVYWVPAAEARPGQPLELAYRLSWYGEDLARPPLARTLATRRDRGANGESERFVIDFSGPELDAIPPGEVVHARVTARRAGENVDLLGQHLVKNPLLGGYRLTLEVRGGPADLRAALERNGQPVTETWAYRIAP